MFNFFSENKKITEKLYEQNLEVAMKNKTLSLLESLYQTSVLTLTPEEMAKAITDIIQKDLNLEFAGIFIFDKNTDTLNPLSFSKSERLVKILEKFGFLFKDIKITNVSKHNFFKQAVYDKKHNITDNIEEVWEELVPNEHLRGIKKQSHIETVLLSPLIKGADILGVLLLGLNRNYQVLNTFEKASIKSFINVITLLIDKAYLYKNLQDSYEITKRAYAVEKKANEELQELDKVKNQFLATTQHDLRTPLTAISGYSELLINGTFGKQTKKTIEVIKKIQEVTQNMKRRADSFLDVAQFKLGKGVVSLNPGVEIELILNEIVNELKFKAESKKVYLNFEKPFDSAQGGPEGDYKISADREKLKSALFNVIDNSVKYTTSGGVTVTVNHKSQITNHKQIPNSNDQNLKQIPNSVLIAVQDTGIGIPVEKVKTLFETQFERSEQAKKTAEGKGVGLYLAGQIIKLHQGKIWAESQGEDKGSIFYIELPLN